MTKGHDSWRPNAEAHKATKMLKKRKRKWEVSYKNKHEHNIHPWNQRQWQMSMNTEEGGKNISSSTEHLISKVSWQLNCKIFSAKLIIKLKSSTRPNLGVNVDSPLPLMESPTNFWIIQYTNLWKFQQP